MLDTWRTIFNVDRCQLIGCMGTGKCDVCHIFPVIILWTFDVFGKIQSPNKPFNGYSPFFFNSINKKLFFFPLQWLTWPSRANKSFPYHVKTNHVGIASEEDDGADYPRHTYAPSQVDENIIIPLSRRTEELINGIYGQYTHESHRNNSNAHSHASFPDDANAPPEILSSNRLSCDSGRHITPQHQQCDGDVSQPQSCTMVNEYEDENQIDSGHLSLDHSGSPSNNTTKSISDNGTPPPDRKGSTHTLDSNQLANELKPAPNKIILEPITQSMQNMKLPAIVPRHLFAAKKCAELEPKNSLN